MKFPRAELALLLFRRIAQTAVFGCAVLLAGCQPETVIRWSPDGAHAIVLGSDTTYSKDRTYLVDGDGKIVGMAPYARVWMPDSRRVVAVRRVKARDWAEVASLLGEERTKAVIRASDELATVVHGYHGDWEKFFDDDAFKHWNSSLPDELGCYLRSLHWDQFPDQMELAFIGGSSFFQMLYYLREKDPESVAPLMAPLTALMVKTGGEMPYFAVSELVVQSAFPEKPETEKLLFRTADSISAVHPSPNGKAIAFVVDEPIRPGLYVIPTEGGERVSIDTGAADADWTPDGRWLTYEKTTISFLALENELLPGRISRREVCDSDGRVLPKTTLPKDLGGSSPLPAWPPAPRKAEMEPPEDLAKVLSSGGDYRAACLPDGRILFEGIEMRYPEPIAGPGAKFKLFALRLGEKPRIEQIVSDEAWQRLQSVDLYSLSPDGKHLAIPGDKGEVAIVSIESGEVREIQGTIEGFREKKQWANKKDLVSVIPSWRTATEFSYVRPAGQADSSLKRAEVVLRSLDGTSRVISATWPDEMTDSFLMRPEPGK